MKSPQLRGWSIHKGIDNYGLRAGKIGAIQGPMTSSPVNWPKDINPFGQGVKWEEGNKAGLVVIEECDSRPMVVYNVLGTIKGLLLEE